MAQKKIYINVSNNENGWWAYVEHHNFYIETKEYKTWETAVSRIETLMKGVLSVLENQSEIELVTVKPKKRNGKK